MTSGGTFYHSLPTVNTMKELSFRGMIEAPLYYILAAGTSLLLGLTRALLSHIVVRS